MSSLRFLWVFAAALFTSVSTTQAATEVPFAFRNGMIWVKVQAGAVPLNFLLDSGAGASVLDSGTARRLGVKAGAAVTVQGTEGNCAAYRVNGFAATVGGLAVSPSMLALDLGAISRNCGGRIDGLLGLDFFRGRVVQIDYAAQKLRIFARGEAVDGGGETLSLTRRNDALCVRVGVNGNSGELLRLDTGCSSALEWVATGAKLRRSGGPSFAAGAGSVHTMQAGVALGREQFGAVKIGLRNQPMFRGEAGLLGNGLLANFRVTVDADRGRLGLARVR